MHRRLLALITLSLIVSALPVSASTFIEQPFEEVVRGSKYIVRGQIIDTWSAWDDAHEIIFTYATVRVTRYFGETTGPDLLVVREAGGTVEGYKMEAIGFPTLRRDQQVVLMLSEWENGAEHRIHAFNQGKYVVRNRGGIETLVADPETQGSERLINPDRGRIQAESVDDGAPGLTIDEFAAMVDSARAGIATGGGRIRGIE